MVDMTNIFRIGIVCALSREADPIIARLGLEQLPSVDPHVPITIFGGAVDTCQVRLALIGQDKRFGVDQIGTNGAVLTSYLLITSFAPDLLLNPGTAGGFLSTGAALGDVFLGQGDVKFHDRRSPIQKYQGYCFGSYPTVSAARLATHLGLRTGVVSSGNSFDCTPIDLEYLKMNDASLKDMEAAAIGWVAWTKQIPFLPVKAVTDWIDSPETAESTFNQNWRKACVALARAVYDIVEFANGRNLREF